MRYTEMFRNEPDVLTVSEAAKLLRIGKNQAYEFVKNGKLSAIKLGKKIIVPKPTLVDFCRNERNYLVLLPK
ncbi:helix-turn-helix domain-containing protein [uncultured Ruminococcus sp.]|uniref:helix-turn-helix domain-containing protein n=1 Tax=uncultured Ruminococcus sp. TaxID=165186 RepID=UPI0025CCBF80|nr:helix-turn-helix domain-containing protein [uncultured Ruminococcus sp.]